MPLGIDRTHFLADKSKRLEKESKVGYFSLVECKPNDHKFCQICFCRLQAKNLVTSLFFVQF